MESCINNWVAVEWFHRPKGPPMMSHFGNTRVIRRSDYRVTKRVVKNAAAAPQLSWERNK